MPKVTREDMVPSIGLADDFDGTIVKARFGVRERYVQAAGSADPMLILTLESPEHDIPIEQGYSTGAVQQWQVGRNELEVVSAKNPNERRFNRNSRAGQLVAAMANAIGEGDPAKGVEFFAKRDKWMTESQFYEGLTFHWKRIPLSTVSGEEREVLLPQTYIGEKAVAAAPKAEAAVAEAPQDVMDKVLAAASGKTPEELRRYCLRDLKGELDAKVHSTFARLVLNRTNPILKRWEEDGTLVLDAETGTYI